MKKLGPLFVLLTNTPWHSSSSSGSSRSSSPVSSPQISPSKTPSRITGHGHKSKKSLDEEEDWFLETECPPDSGK